MADEAPLLSEAGPEPAPVARDRLAMLLDRSSLSPARLVAGALVVATVLVVGWWLLRPPAAPIEASLPVATSSVPSAGPDVAGAGASTPAAPSGSLGGTAGVEDAAPTELVVHAAGALLRPGVYRLEPGARVADLVTAAGGLAPDADGDRLNLAAPLADGERIYTPHVGEATVPVVVSGATPEAGLPDGAGSGTGSDAPVDLNRATLEQLDTLPGVGPTTAQAIVDYRTEHGSFASVDELLEVGASVTPSWPTSRPGLV
ncbi:MAG: helix-hairpin-helix domain-containing protein [Acidimicrobiales bacterium]